MPEFNRNFAQGKMNKDLDERLIPAGQYRDAMNVQVSTSDGSNVGSLENILGNGQLSTNLIPEGGYCVGSIVDNEVNCIYYLVAGNEFTHSSGNRIAKNYIVKYSIDDNNLTFVFVDIYKVTTQVTGIVTEEEILFGEINFTQVSSSYGLRKGMVFDNDNNIQFVFDDNKFLPSNEDVPTGTYTFEKESVLGFNSETNITAINIVEDLLMYTDNINEPKTINIKRSILGTGSGDNVLNSSGANNSSDFHTRLVSRRTDGSFNDEGFEVVTNFSLLDSGVPVYSELENNTTIRKGPLAPPTLRMSSSTVERALRVDSPFNPVESPFFIISGGQATQVPSGSGFTLQTDEPVSYFVGDFILITQDLTQPPTSFTDHDVRVRVDAVNSNTNFDVTILAIADDLDTSTGFLTILEQPDPLFEFKFPRFSYRYKYVDGQYSAFAPFSEVAFLPGPYEYYPKEGYNLGMANRVRSLRVENYAPIPDHRPKDIVEIDVLYKEEGSTTVYTVKTIKPSDGQPLWPLSTALGGYSVGAGNAINDGLVFRGSLNIESELIHAVVPANQLLRPWDNVPRKALAQEVSANRLIYANYVQNYDLVDSSNKLLTPELKVGLVSKSYGDPGISPNIGVPFKSIKTQRTYQLGVVYKDEFGRETPVLADKEKGSFTVGKEFCDNLNSLKVSVLNSAPTWAKSFKFFIKETSNEYYNLAMDRWYNAEDGNIWLSFPSSDRNKVDEETFLELKKAHDSDVVVEQPARYKILAISNEAPEFIKLQRKSLGTLLNSSHDGVDDNQIGSAAIGYPISGENLIHIRKNAFEENFDPDVVLPIASDCSVKIRTITGEFSKYYDIVSIKKDNIFGQDNDGYKITISDTFDADVDNVTGGSFTPATNRLGLQIEIVQNEIENKPEFEGKFFAKIYKDQIIEDFIMILDDERNLVVVDAYETSYLHTYNGNSSNPYGGVNLGRNTNNATMGIALNVRDQWRESQAKKDHVNPYKTSYTWGDNSNYGGPLINGAFEVRDTNAGDATGANNWGIGKGDHALEFWHNYFTRKGQAEIFIDDAWAVSWRQTPHTLDNAFPDPNNSSPYHNAPNHNGDFNAGEIAGDDLIEEARWGEGNGFAQNGSRGIRGNLIDISVTGGFHGEFNENDAAWSEFGNNGWKVPEAFQFLNPYILNDGNNKDEYNFLRNLTLPGIKWRFKEDPEKTIYEVTKAYKHYGIINFQLRNIDLFGSQLINPFTLSWYITQNAERLIDLAAGGDGINIRTVLDGMSRYQIESNKRNKFTIAVDKPFAWDPRSTIAHDGTETVTIQILGRYGNEDIGFSSENPAVWETKPKEEIELDIYYEVSRAYPIEIESNNTETVLLPGYADLVSVAGNLEPEFNRVNNLRHFAGSENASLSLTNPITANVGTELLINDGYGGQITLVVAQLVNNSTRVNVYKKFHSAFTEITLPWHNCYVFGNGVESDRIRDDFNQPTIQNGVKASTTIAEQYKEERRSQSFIFSGIFNSLSGVNRLNQFIQAEPITKDLDPDNGSIQKLFTRDTDIITFCEDKVLKVLSDKDALFESGGNAQLTAANKVLGQAIAFAGDYGISRNPESFAADKYRCYFTDTQRGAVIRLSKDGMTPISDYGMKDYFTDTFNNIRDIRLIGTFDQRKDNYNLTISSKGKGPSFLKAIEPTTITYNEQVKGWVSFKSFHPESGVGVNNDYYTFKNGSLWKHHTNANRNDFYSEGFVPSYVEILFNDAPSSVKNFQTIKYEGTQAKVDRDARDDQYYNLSTKRGWYVDFAFTDLQDGKVPEFIDKEGKWFNFIKGACTDFNNLDEKEFTVQGIGQAESIQHSSPGELAPVSKRVIFRDSSFSVTGENWD